MGLTVSVRIKLIVYGQGLVGVVNGIPDSMLCLTSFKMWLGLYTSTSRLIKHNETTHTNLISVTYFP